MAAVEVTVPSNNSSKFVVDLVKDFVVHFKGNVGDKFYVYPKGNQKPLFSPGPGQDDGYEFKSDGIDLTVNQEASGIYLISVNSQRHTEPETNDGEINVGSLPTSDEEVRVRIDLSHLHLDAPKKEK